MSIMMCNFQIVNFINIVKILKIFEIHVSKN